MPKLKWDQIGDRVFEQGVSHGVLYLPDGSAVPWNGLTSVSEQSGRSTEPLYFDGVKFEDFVSLGDFSGMLSAITYPDEFLELEGYGEVNSGVFVGDQEPKLFGLSYRTRIGSDVDTDATDYKLHLIYNVTAIPSDKNYATMTLETTLTEFEWTITAVPQEVPGFRPTAHFVFDSRYADPDLLADVELALYGGETANPQLPAFADMVEIITTFFRVEIIDNKDGTWTAVSKFPGYISMLSATEFQLDNVDAEFIDADTYQITDTRS